VRSGLRSFLRDEKWEGARFALLFLVASVTAELLFGDDVSTVAVAGIIFGLVITIGVYMVRSEEES
jgi:hypothetical protein